MSTFYDVLNVRADDDAERINKAYRKAVKANHPLRNAGDLDARSPFAQIVRANTILRDPELRAIYDRMLELEEQQCRPQSKVVAISNAAYNIAADTIFAVVLALVLAGGAPKAAAVPPPLHPIIAGEPRDELEGADAVVPNGQMLIVNSHESLSLAGLAVGTRPPDKRPLDTRVVQLNPSTPAIQPLDSEQAAILLQQGRELLRTGDIEAARVAFQPLANTGNVEAALALGKTFDPRFLAQHDVIGIVGDEAKARAWYQRAMELGSTEAKDILAHMTTKGKAGAK